jgi:hypothetical protein
MKKVVCLFNIIEGRSDCIIHYSVVLYMHQVKVLSKQILIFNFFLTDVNVKNQNTELPGIVSMDSNCFCDLAVNTRKSIHL